MASIQSKISKHTKRQNYMSKILREECEYMCVCVCVCVCMHACMCMWARTIDHQAPLSMGFSRQVYWSGLPFPSPGDLPNLGIDPVFPLSCTGRHVLYHRDTWEVQENSQHKNIYIRYHASLSGKYFKIIRINIFYLFTYFIYI